MNKLMASIFALLLGTSAVYAEQMQSFGDWEVHYVVLSLAFRKVAEGDAVYYPVEIKHTDEETLRFRITISAPGRTPEMLLAFQQKL